MQRVPGRSLLIPGPFLVLVLLASLQAPPSHAQSASVNISVQAAATVDCYGTMQGSVKVVNDGYTKITVVEVDITLTDVALGTAFGRFTLNIANPVVPGYSTQDYPFSFQMTGGTTQKDPEPAAVQSSVFYSTGNATSSTDVLSGSASFSITGCQLHGSSGTASATDIPEFPAGALAAGVSTVVIVASFLAVRRRMG